MCVIDYWKDFENTPTIDNFALSGPLESTPQW